MDKSSKRLKQQSMYSEYSDFKNKSIQGKIFDQSIMECLKGDDDQTQVINNMLDAYILGNDDTKGRSGGSNVLFSFDRIDQKILSNSSDSTNIQKSIPPNVDKVLLFEQESNTKNITQNTIVNKEKVPSSKEFEIKEQTKQLPQQIIHGESVNIFNKYSQNFQNIQFVQPVEPQRGIKGQQLEVDEEVSLDSQMLDAQIQSLQLPYNKLNSPIAISPSSQKNINFSSTQFIHQTKALNLGLDKEQLENYEKAAMIINKVFSKSMNRIQRINKHVQNFIQFLKYRMNGRRIFTLYDKEYQLVNDVCYFKAKKRSEIFFPNFIIKLIIQAQLKIPLPVFMPTSSLRVYWDLFQVIFTYTFIYIYSILIFFYNQEQDTYFIQQFFKYTFFVFLLDTLVNFNTAYFDKDCVIIDRKQIAWKYMTSSLFLTDCINLMVMGSKVIVKSTHLVYNPKLTLYILFFNLLIFLKLNGIKPKRNRFSYVFTLTENQKHIMRLFDQLLSVISVAHVVSLAWYSLGVYESQNGYQVSWIQKYGFDDLSYLEKYIYSIYWSITTMTTVGYGDISASNYVEALFITFAMILFSCVFAYSINNIGFILQEIQKSSKQLNDNMTTIQRYLNRKNVNISLQSRVRHYLSFLAEEQKDRNQQAELAILGTLSNKLRGEITIEINTRILKKNAIFTANFSTQTLRQLVFIMQEVLIAPNEIIFEEGDSDSDDDQSIYFIENGIIEIYQTNRNQGHNQQSNDRTHLLQQLKKNQFFGEISFFSGLSRKASARSVNLSTLYKISRKDFIKLISENPEDFERFKMMEEEIKFQSDLSSIFIDCYACNQSGHIAQNCPRIHQIFDTQFKILKENFSLFQERREKIRRSKNKPFSGRQEIPKKIEICKNLKQNYRNYNTFTQILFQTDMDMIAYDQIDHQDSNQPSDYQPPSTESSDSSSESESAESSSRNSPKSILQKKKSNTSSNNEKIKNYKKGTTKKITTLSTKQLNSSMKKEEDKQSCLNSLKDLNSIENLEHYLNQEKNVSLPQQIARAIYTNSELEPENLMLKKSTSLMDRISEHQHSTKRESLDKGLEKVKEVMQTTQEHIQSSMSPNNQLSFKPVNNNSSERINSSMRGEHSNQSVQENNTSKNNNGSNAQSEEKLSNIRKQQNKRKILQGSYTQNSVGDQNLSEEKLKKSSTNIKQKMDEMMRPSIEVLVSNAIHQTYQMNQQSEMNKMRSSLNQLEDKIQSFSQLFSLKSVKQFDQLPQLQQFPSHKKSTLKSHSSSVFKKLSGFNQDFRLSSCNQNAISSDKSQQNNSEQMIKFSEKLIRQPTSPQMDAPQSQKMLERISKLLGLQGSFLNILKQGNTIEQSQALNQLSMEFFDVMTNFKRFFPHNNISNILLQLKLKRKICKKQKLKTPKQQHAQKQRRHNILFDQNSSRKSLFCNAIQQKYFLSEFNINNNKPTYLSYGVSQQGDTVFPKNSMIQELNNLFNNNSAI